MRVVGLQTQAVRLLIVRTDASSPGGTAAKPVLAPPLRPQRRQHVDRVRRSRMSSSSSTSVAELVDVVLGEHERLVVLDLSVLSDGVLAGRSGIDHLPL